MAFGNDDNNEIDGNVLYWGDREALPENWERLNDETAKLLSKINGSNLGGEWIIAVSFGFWFVVTLASMTLAMNYGHMGITLLIQNASLIVPTLYSLIVWRERLTAAKAVGIFFVLTMLALSTKDGSASADEKTQRRWNRRLWVIFTLLAFVGDSLLSVLQGSMAMSQTDPVVFTFWTSAFSAGFAALLFIAANHGRGNALPSIKANAKAFWLLCAGRFLTRPQPAQTPACP